MTYAILPGHLSYYIFDDNEDIKWMDHIPLVNKCTRAYQDGLPYVVCHKELGGFLLVIPSDLVPLEVIIENDMIPDVICEGNELKISKSKWGWKAVYGKKKIYMEK